MDAVIARIKAYTLVINPDLEDNDFLDFVVNDIIDRALVYMNRDQLVDQYIEDLTDYPDLTDDFWKGYSYPIPPRVERSLASVVVGAYKTVSERNSNTTGAISSVSDNGQSVSYRNEVANYLSSSDDAEVFSGTLRLLRRYVLPTIIRDTDNMD